MPSSSCRPSRGAGSRSTTRPVPRPRTSCASPENDGVEAAVAKNMGAVALRRFRPFARPSEESGHRESDPDNDHECDQPSCCLRALHVVSRVRRRATELRHLRDDRRRLVPEQLPGHDAEPRASRFDARHAHLHKGRPSQPFHPWLRPGLADVDDVEARASGEVDADGHRPRDAYRDSRALGLPREDVRHRHRRSRDRVRTAVRRPDRPQRIRRNLPLWKGERHTARDRQRLAQLTQLETRLRIRARKRRENGTDERRERARRSTGRRAGSATRLTWLTKAGVSTNACTSLPTRPFPPMWPRSSIELKSSRLENGEPGGFSVSARTGCEVGVGNRNGTSRPLASVACPTTLSASFIAAAVRSPRPRRGRSDMSARSRRRLVSAASRRRCRSRDRRYSRRLRLRAPRGGSERDEARVRRRPHPRASRARDPNTSPGS